jgi:hypothetical protein
MEIKYKKAKARAAWLKVYEELGCVSKAAKRCGIASPLSIGGLLGIRSIENLKVMLG